MAKVGMYVKACEEIPAPNPLEEGQVLIAVAPIVAAKLALYAVMRQQGVTNVALACRLGLQENAVRRLLDPGHRSPMTHDGGRKGLEAVGHSLVVEDRAAVQYPEVSPALSRLTVKLRYQAGIRHVVQARVRPVAPD